MALQKACGTVGGSCSRAFRGAGGSLGTIQKDCAACGTVGGSCSKASRGAEAAAEPFGGHALALWKEAAVEPFGGTGGSLGTIEKDCAATAGTVESLQWPGRRQSRNRTEGLCGHHWHWHTAGTVEGLWHCGRKLQQSLFGGAGGSLGTVQKVVGHSGTAEARGTGEEAAAEPFGGRRQSRNHTKGVRPVGGSWKLQQSLSGGRRQSWNHTLQKACGTVGGSFSGGKEAAVEPFGGTGGSLGTMKRIVRPQLTL